MPYKPCKPWGVSTRFLGRHFPWDAFGAAHWIEAFGHPTCGHTFGWRHFDAFWICPCQCHLPRSNVTRANQTVLIAVCGWNRQIVAAFGWSWNIGSTDYFRMILVKDDVSLCRVDDDNSDVRGLPNCSCTHTVHVFQFWMMVDSFVLISCWAHLDSFGTTFLGKKSYFRIGKPPADHRLSPGSKPKLCLPEPSHSVTNDYNSGTPRFQHWLLLKKIELHQEYQSKWIMFNMFWVQRVSAVKDFDRVGVIFENVPAQCFVSFKCTKLLAAYKEINYAFNRSTVNISRINHDKSHFMSRWNLFHPFPVPCQNQFHFIRCVFVDQLQRNPVRCFPK